MSSGRPRAVAPTKWGIVRVGRWGGACSCFDKIIGLNEYIIVVGMSPVATAPLKRGTILSQLKLTAPLPKEP